MVVVVVVVVVVRAVLYAFRTLACEMKWTSTMNNIIAQELDPRGIYVWV